MAETNRLLGAIEQTIKRLVEMLCAGVEYSAVQQLFTQLTVLLMQLARSSVGVEIGDQVHERLKRVLAQLAGAPRITLLVAEHLRLQILTIEQATDAMLKECGKQWPRLPGDGIRQQTPTGRLAGALVEHLRLLQSQLRSVSAACEFIPLIIPATLDILAMQAQIDERLVTPALPQALDHAALASQSTCSTALTADSATGPTSVPATIPAAPDQRQDRQRFWTGGRKAQDLQQSMHGLAYDLIGAMHRYRTTIDGAQGLGGYNPPRLRAVAEALSALPSSTIPRTEHIITCAAASVRFWWL